MFLVKNPSVQTDVDEITQAFHKVFEVEEKIHATNLIHKAKENMIDGIGG